MHVFIGTIENVLQNSGMGKFLSELVNLPLKISCRISSARTLDQSTLLKRKSNFLNKEETFFQRDFITIQQESKIPMVSRENILLLYS